MKDCTNEGAQDCNASFVFKLAESLDTSRLPKAHIYTDILEICLILLENVWNMIYMLPQMFSVCRNNSERIKGKGRVWSWTRLIKSMLDFVPMICDKSSSVYPQRSPGRQRPITRAINPLTAHLHKPRRAQGHNGSWKPRLRTPKEPTISLGPYQGCPSRGTAPLSRHETHQKKSPGAAVQITFWSKGICYLGTWNRLWDAREERFGIAQGFPL